MRRTLALIATSLLTLAFAPLTSANAAQNSAQQTYSCQGTGGNSKLSVGLSMSLNAPAQVAPGSTLSLRGELALRFPDELRQQAQTFGFSEIDGYSDSLSSTITVNGHRSSFGADRWQTGRAPIRDPMVIRAPITFPAYHVPANARGKLAVALPQNGFTKNITGDSPKKVAFTGVAKVSGNGQKKNSQMSCLLAKGSPSTVAVVPIRAASAAESPSGETRAGSKAGTPTAGGTVSDGQPASENSGTGARTGAGEVATEDRPAAAHGLSGKPRPESSATAPVENRLGATDATAQHPVTPTSDDTVVVPPSALWLGGIGICAAALAYAAWTNHRLRLMRAERDD